MVGRETCTEGSRTAKSGTDEQEGYKRLKNRGKQTQHCNARDQQLFLSRCHRNWRKDNALTRGGLGLYVIYSEKSAEAIVIERYEL